VQYMLLGRSGLPVSSLCLGTMGFLADGTWADQPGNLTGEYRTTHAFIFRDGRWMISTSQMTGAPARREELRDTVDAKTGRSLNR
jgi:aryl-alcohol dehydrogenase-like predicted oxidoreductase